MINNQHKLAPLAGNTMLFQRADRCLPARHFTRLAHPRVADPAMMNASHENCATKPGACLATLIAGWAGKPVCMEIQTVQIISAPKLKNNKVNQSMNALMLRFKVGSAKAANVAKAGNAKSNARSLMPDSQVLKMATLKNQSGNDKWGLAERLFNW
jgi:hypothetical protein